MQATDQKLGPLEAARPNVAAPVSANLRQVVDFPGHLRMRGKANDMVKEASQPVGQRFKKLQHVLAVVRCRLDVSSTWSMRKTSPS